MKHFDMLVAALQSDPTAHAVEVAAAEVVSEVARCGRATFRLPTTTAEEVALDILASYGLRLSSSLTTTAPLVVVEV